MAAFSSIAIGLALAGAGMQYREQRQARALQRESRNQSTAADSVRSRLERSRAAKEERRRRAILLASSRASGSGDSSAEIGGAGAIGSNFGAARAEQRMQSATTSSVNSLNQQAADRSTRANMFGEVAGLGNSLYNWANS